MAPVLKDFEALLQRVVEAQMDEVSGSCADMLPHDFT